MFNYKTRKELKIENHTRTCRRIQCQQLLKKMLREAGLIDQKHGELTVLLG